MTKTDLEAMARELCTWIVGQDNDEQLRDGILTALTAAFDAGAEAMREAAAEAAIDAYVPHVPYQGDDGSRALRNAAIDIRGLKLRAERQSSEA